MKSFYNILRKQLTKMKGTIQKIESACKEYTDHEFVQVSLLGVIGILTIIAFAGQMIVGV